VALWDCSSSIIILSLSCMSATKDMCSLCHAWQQCLLDIVLQAFLVVVYDAVNFLI
jgi:hypothetical protein